MGAHTHPIKPPLTQGGLPHPLHPPTFFVSLLPPYFSFLLMMNTSAMNKVARGRQKMWGAWEPHYMNGGLGRRRCGTQNTIGPSFLALNQSVSSIERTALKRHAQSDVKDFQQIHANTMRTAARVQCQQQLRKRVLLLRRCG